MSLLIVKTRTLSSLTKVLYVDFPNLGDVRAEDATQENSILRKIRNDRQVAGFASQPGITPAIVSSFYRVASNAYPLRFSHSC